MKVIKNEVKPVVTPPATYDIIGLTENEAKLLKILVGKISGYGPLRNLSHKLYTALPFAGTYRFNCLVFTNETMIGSRNDFNEKELESLHFDENVY